MRRWHRAILPVLLVVWAGCEGARNPAELLTPEVSGPQVSEGTGEEDTDELNFVRFTALAPPLEREASFWAVRGEERSVKLFYELSDPESGEVRTEVLLEFRVPEEALLSDPSGAPFEEGDSVRITVRVDDLDRFIFDFQPSGLRFDPEHPASLTIWYTHADADLNGDEEVSDEDEETEPTLTIYQREDGESSWDRLDSLVNLEENRVEAQIHGFTMFALATS
jgi:hypothetical protein